MGTRGSRGGSEGNNSRGLAGGADNTGTTVPIWSDIDQRGWGEVNGSHPGVRRTPWE